MSWTTPKTWVVNEIWTSTDANTYIRDNSNFLFNTPTCRVYNSAAISVANDVDQVLTFNSERKDNDGLHSTSSNTGRLTASRSGSWFVQGCIRTDEVATATWLKNLRIRKNGTTTVMSSEFITGGPRDMLISATTEMAAGDYVELTHKQISGASKNIERQDDWSPVFGMTWLGG